MKRVEPTADGSVLVYVTKRLPIDENQLKTDSGQIAEGLAHVQQAALFQQWLKLRRAAAQLETNYRS